jgi:hypothetical protein
MLLLIASTGLWDARAGSAVRRAPADGSPSFIYFFMEPTMNYALPAQVGLACLILTHTLLSFMKPSTEAEEKPQRAQWSLFGQAEALSADEEYARLARKAQAFWQGGLSLRDLPAGRR